MDVLGAGLHTPGSEGVRWQTGLEPLGERLWGDEVVATGKQIILMVRRRVGHGRNFEKTTRVQREREEGASRRNVGLSGGCEEKANRESCEEEIG